MFNIRYDNLVLFSYAIYPLRIAALERLNDTHDELAVCEEYINEGFIKRNEYGGVRLSDKGCDLLSDIFLQHKNKLIQFLDKAKGKVNVKDIADTLSISESCQCELWIGFFFRKLKNEKVITDFSISDNGLCCWYYD